MDLDFDGLGDLVATGREQLSLKFGSGTGGVRVVGSLWPLRTKEHPLAVGLGLDVGRMDRDRLWDIAVADGSRVIVFQGEMNLSFQPRVSLRAGPQPVGVVFTDLNGDGLDDLVVANEKPTEDLQGDLAVLLNTGDGMKQHRHYEAGVRTPDLEAGHLDGDAHGDIAVASRLSGEVTLLYGDGEGNLGRSERLPSGRGTCRLTVTDLDGDGRDDIIAANGLDDTIAIFLNRRETPARKSRSAARAAVCESFLAPQFRAEGLSRPYQFVAEFRLPHTIREPSGVAWLGGISATQLILVSDDDSALFRATLDRGRKRLLVGPRIALEGAPEGALDLEAATFDRWSGNLFLASARDSTILRTTVWGQVLGIAETSIESSDNDGIEGLALRRLLDNTPLLYVLRERRGQSLMQPPVHVYGLEEDPFSLKLRLKTGLPINIADQSGAAVLGDSLLVVGRLTRSLTEVRLKDDEGFAPGPRSTGFRELTVDLLGLRYEDTPLLGMVEGIAADGQSGDLFLLVDSNGKTVGHEGRNRGPEGRLIWLRSLAKETARIEPRRVAAKQILIPWKGDREEGLKIARECLELARRGEEFDQLAVRYHSPNARFPALLRVVTPPASPAMGEQARSSLPIALAKVLFALEVGEVGLCEFHREESPEGWYVVLRIE
ncbi:MAG: FG-GAP-like repeat-containing protein [Planctomycetota bacterium]